MVTIFFFCDENIQIRVYRGFFATDEQQLLDHYREGDNGTLVS